MVDTYEINIAGINFPAYPKSVFKNQKDAYTDNLKNASVKTLEKLRMTHVPKHIEITYSIKTNEDWFNFCLGYVAKYYNVIDVDLKAEWISRFGNELAFYKHKESERSS